MHNPVRAVLSSVGFLTRIPVPAAKMWDPKDLAAATPYFPLVGLLIGGIGALAYVLAAKVWPPVLAVVISTGATVLATGAFHEDALADAADGFGGGWDRDRVLAIMKDSRVGSYAVVTLVLVLAAKIAALTSLATTANVVGALIVAHTLGRWSSLPLIAWLPYVREGESTGKPFAASVTIPRLAGGTVLALAIVGGVLRLGAIPVVLVALGITAVCGAYVRRRIGGITGDCLGATNQLVELATYVVLCAHHG